MKQVKKLLIMLVVLALTASMICAAAYAVTGSFEVEAVNVTAEAGKDVQMTVKVNSNPGVVAAILNIKYDAAKITLKEVSSASFLNDEVEVNMANGECTVVLDNALSESDITTTGALLTLTFTVAEGVTGEIAVDLTVVEARNYALASVPVNAVDGKVTIGAQGPSVEDVELPSVLDKNDVTFSGSTMTVKPDETTPACVVLVKNGDEYTPVAATKNDDGSYSYDMSAMPEGASIVVAVKGDLNGDGTLSALEARQILKAANDSYTLGNYEKAVGDLDGDGAVSALEARQILKAANNSFTMPW